MQGAKAILFGLLLAGTGASGLAAAPSADARVEAGRYLVKLGGCNDCHTPGYAFSNGKIPEQDWLTGDQLGWRGPWGTTYPANLRLLFSRMTEQEWLTLAKTKEMRPPMPWFNLREMKDEDLKAVYQFIRWLGPKGQAAPPYLPPTQAPAGPVVTFPMSK